MNWFLTGLLPSPELAAVSRNYLVLNLCMTIGNEKCACLMKSALKPFYVRMKPSNHIPFSLFSIMLFHHASNNKSLINIRFLRSKYLASNQTDLLQNCGLSRSLNAQENVSLAIVFPL